MFDRIIDFIIESLGFFQFFTVINQYEKGVVFRLGKSNRVISTGIHFYIPFYIETVFSDSIVLDTRDLGSQTLTTSDGYQIVVTTVISFSICDIEKVFTKIQSVETVLEDTLYGIISAFVINNDFSKLLQIESMQKIKLKCNVKTKKFGVCIEGIHFMDIAEIKTIRIIGDNSTYVDEGE